MRNSAAEPSEVMKGRGQQKRERLQLASRCLLKPMEYELYGFNRRGRDYPYMLNFMTIYALRNQFRGALNDPNWKVVLDNKWIFHSHYEPFGIPLPEAYGVYDSGRGFTSTGEPLGSREDLHRLLQETRPPALVVKPLGGIMGKQVLIFNELRYPDGDIEAVTNTGSILSFSELAATLDRPASVRYYMVGGYELATSGYLLEKKLEQHELLNRIAPYTTNTIRVVTFLDHAGQVHIHFTVLRLGREGNVADNWDRGGLSVAVDPETGVLGDGVLKPKYGGQWMQSHPDSGVRFTGMQIPGWKEILAICSRAARVTPGVRSVGWDVALTPTGPVIIEGNPDWDLPMVQVHTDGFLQPAIREQLSHFGLTFPENSLPSVPPGDWWTFLKERRRSRAFYKRGR